ncbi:TIGR02302 family protein [Roseovarius salinarum]|uniref:TIGR02302 family protein n=1 Tax=Roseovarius salinarum TaxID=1981892 RepID=UPI000C346414|nr:TIGR02302 family protein [Roseovarius salinarum]
MPKQPDIDPELNTRLRRSLALTRAGLWAERLVQAFWPVWSILAACAAALVLGLHDLTPLWAVRGLAALAALALMWFAVRGVTRFCRPRRDEALARVDAPLAGHPLAALSDDQAVGRDDPQSQALWRAHRARMAERAAAARAVAPDLRLSRRDPYGLRYVALLGLVVALMFGSIWRAGSVGEMAPGGGAALAGGPAWEGWIEPPAYTGRPSLYLNDQKGMIRVPEGSRVTLRFYGEVGALDLSETVSGRDAEQLDPDAPEQAFDVRQDGRLKIEGPGGRSWQVTAIADAPPRVSLTEETAKTDASGRMSLPFKARDDYAVAGGTAIFRLDLDRVERRHGLAAEPDPREPIVLDLPMPITGDRAEFTESLIENLSKHPWAHLPVTLELQVRDDLDQTGASAPRKMRLPARRFFDPLAAAVIEQRRDLLWTRNNASRVIRVLRAVSHRPEDGLFRSKTAYLRMRVIMRRLETLVRHDSFDSAAQEEIAAALWDLAVKLEDGDIDDALERMRAAQEKLSEAIKNGASQEEIARLMQELRDATQDYLRQKSRRAQQDGEQGETGQQQSQDGMRMTQQDLQEMMDRIQELMEQGRTAEAQQALEEFQRMMENMRVTEGQQGQSQGQQAMEGLSETLRNQQGLSDQAFRDLQEQFNPDAQAGQSQGNEGRSGAQGRGQSHQGQGEGQGNQGAREGQGGERQSDGEGAEGSLADRQRALRRELERQRQALPGGGTEQGEAARDSLERAEDAMRGAEESLREDDLAGALDRQSEAMEALREGMRNLGEAMAENNRTQGGQGQARGQTGGQRNDPLGRRTGQGSRVGTQDELLQGEDVYRRARDLLDEIRRRSGQGERPDVELEYLERLLDRF